MKLLSLTGRNIEKIIDRNNEKEMQKTLSSIEKQKDDIEDLTFQVQAAMFNELDEITEDEVGEYGESITIRLTTYNEYVERLQEKLDILKKEEAGRVRTLFEEKENKRAQLRYE